MKRKLSVGRLVCDFVSEKMSRFTSNRGRVPRGASFGLGTRRLRTEPLEERRLLSLTTFVDNDLIWDTANGGDVDGDGYYSAGDVVTYAQGELGEINGLIYGSDAFDSIQSAIDATDPGGTVTVAPGEYLENLTIGKDLTLTGLNSNPSDVVINALGGDGMVLTGGNITVQDLTVTMGMQGIVCSGASDSVVTLDNLAVTDSSSNVLIHNGSVLVTGCTISGSIAEGVTVDGGTAVIDQNDILGNSTGVWVDLGGAATITNNTIAPGMGMSLAGVYVSGGTAMLEGNNLNDNFMGLLVNDGVVDAGQLLSNGVDYTGLGISSGGNDFSSYMLPDDPMMGAIMCFAPDFIAGPQGLPTDISALNNIWFSPNPADIETVIYHDPDPGNSVSRFVDYAVLSDLDVAVTATTIDEGLSTSVTGSFVSDAQEHTVMIDWGDGNSDTVSVTTSAFDFTGSHVYGDQGIYTINVTVYDSQGGEITDTASVEVLNVDPTIDEMIVEDGAEGSLLAFSASATDVVDDTLTYTWDFGDGSAAVAGAAVSYAFAENDSYTVTLTVEDEDGGIATQTATVTVDNADPVVAIVGAPAEAQMDVPVDLTSTVVDPGTLDTHTYDWSVTKDGNPYGVSGTDTAYTFTPDGNGVYVVTLVVTDDDGGVGTDTAEVAVTNAVPTIAVDSAAVTADEGALAVNTGTFDDANVDDDVVVTASLGVVTKTGVNTGTWSWSFDATDGPYVDTVTITADDGRGGVATTTFDLTVSNVAPVLNDVTVAIEENSANGTSVGTLAATDPGDDSVTYTLVGGSGETAFAVDATTGEITVADQTQLDFEYTGSYTLDVEVVDDDGATDTAVVTVELVNRPSVTGAVFVDVNENGLYEVNEPTIDGVIVELLDASGNPVLDGVGNPITAVTEDGYYLFEDLPAGTYQLHEIQPTGVNDGVEILGTLGGAIPANDIMQIALATTDAHDYIFAEVGDEVEDGDTASTGFWNGRRGRNLLTAAGDDLAIWLTDTFSNVFGDELVGADGYDVYRFYRTEIFRHRSVLSLLTAKVDIEFMSLALATYFTDVNLAGDIGASYGFNVSQTGIATNVVNVGISGDAFGVTDGTDMTIMQMLLATNNLTDSSDNLSGYTNVYDTNGDGRISLSEAYLRVLAHDLYRDIIRDGR